MARLRVSAGQAQGATGNWAVPLLFANAGAQSCTLYGYPGVSWVDSSGGQIGVPARRIPAPHSRPPRTVVLSPGQTASSVVLQPTSSDQKAAGCSQERAAGLRVYPPGSTSSVILTQGDLAFQAALTACTAGAATAGVTAVQAR